MHAESPPQLPDAALVDWVHGTAGFTLVGGGKFRRVGQSTDYPACTSSKKIHIGKQQINEYM